MHKSLAILVALMFVFPGCLDDKTDNLDVTDDSKALDLAEEAEELGSIEIPHEE